MIGYWGYLQFETNDDWLQYPSNIERTVKGRYATFYPGDGSRAKRQFKGAETGTLTFTMYLDQRFNSNLRDLLAEMADWVNTGVAGELVIGNRSYGYNMWVCTKMVEKFKEVIHGGIITRAEVEVTLDEVLLLQKNIAFWLNTPRGSLPQMRDFGLNYDVIDEPLQTFKMKITVDTISKVRELYGVKIKTINVTADENGKATLKITI